MNKALAVMDFDILQRMSIALFKSGYFQDVKNEAQAIVKVMAGSELGIPPFASMAGIHIIQGKPTLGANLIATLVKNDPRYDYRIKHVDNSLCSIDWFENGEISGRSSFYMDEAIEAGLANKDNWKKYPSDMLFARALTRGARRYAPGIFGGAPVYTPEELGADVDPDGYVEGEILEHIEKAQEPIDMSDETHYEGTGALGDKDGFIVESYPGATIDEQVAEFKEPVYGGPSIHATELARAKEEAKKQEISNGKPASNKIADAWLWVEDKFVNDNINLGFLADGLVMTGKYKAREHVANLLNGKECQHLRDAGLVVDFRRKVSRKGAGEIWNLAIERKEAAESKNRED